MLSLISLAVLATAPVKVATTGFVVTGYEERLAEAWVERFATVMAEGGHVKVTTQRDVVQLLGLERQKQLLGCGDEASSCLTELAGALGVDGVLSANIVKSGAGTLATVKVVRVKDASVWVSASERFTTVEALQDWLDETARRFALEVGGVVARRPPFVRFVPGLLGLAAGTTGAVLFALSKGDAATLMSAASTLRPDLDVGAVTQRGRAFEAVGLSLIGLGVAGLAASALWLLIGGDDSAVSLVPLNGGALFVLGGALP